MLLSKPLIEKITPDIFGSLDLSVLHLLSQNIVYFIGIFCKRGLWFLGAYSWASHIEIFGSLDLSILHLLSQNIVYFIGIFCKRDLWFLGVYSWASHIEIFGSLDLSVFLIRLIRLLSHIRLIRLLSHIRLIRLLSHIRLIRLLSHIRLIRLLSHIRLMRLLSHIRLIRLLSPDTSFESRGLRWLPWKHAWNLVDFRENLFDIYRESRENLYEILAVVTIKVRSPPSVGSLRESDVTDVTQSQM